MKNITNQKKEKLLTANTYASCGRNDPARKRRLNRIPACRVFILASVKMKIPIVSRNQKENDPTYLHTCDWYIHKWIVLLIVMSIKVFIFTWFNNIKSCVKGDFHAQLAPKAFGGSVRTRWWKSMAWLDQTVQKLKCSIGSIRFLPRPLVWARICKAFSFLNS